jgi:hypothetical protein
MVRWPTNFFVWWLGLTVLYLAFFFSASGYFAGVTGLFVPYGFFNSTATLSLLLKGNVIVLIPLALLIFCLIKSEWMLSRLNISSPWLRVILNLLVLLVLTLLTDLAIWGKWLSFTNTFG